jgi:hypothetical protein
MSTARLKETRRKSGNKSAQPIMFWHVPLTCAEASASTRPTSVFHRRYLMKQGVCASRGRHLVAMLLLGSVPRWLVAQVVPGKAGAIGSYSAERSRLAEITGSAVAEPADSARDGMRGVRPTLRLIWNSELPASGNNGALWAGRGLNIGITGGGILRRRMRAFGAELAVLPEVVYSQNTPFQFLPGRDSARSAFSSPWHTERNSADLPLRFGDQSIRAIALGQSSLTFSKGAIAFGASAANEWWGPGIRNTLVLSNNAGGIPRLFLRSARPLESRIGLMEARIFGGALTESPFFDRNSGNDARSASGMLVTLRPAFDSDLLLGASRMVIAPASSNARLLTHALDVLTRWEPVRSSSDTAAGGTTRQQSDQIASLFFRWAFPADGLEAYAEWSRMELPRSLREYLEAPFSTEAYILGAQWMSSASSGRRLRLQSEFTYLEQTIVWSDRPTVDYYSGRAAVQGFTQRGQVLGAAIGPGSSNQFVAAELVGTDWSGGIFASRTRTENDALYREQFPAPTRHDVTLEAGARGGYRFLRMDVSGELALARRLNYLFQSDYGIQSPIVTATDITNLSLRLRFAPR